MNVPYLLTLITFLPAAAGAVLLSAKPLQGNAARGLALAATLAVLILSGIAWFGFAPSATDRFQFVERADWITSLKGGLKIEYKIRMPVWGIAASPVVEKGLLIVQIGGEDNACFVAFDKKTGEEKWTALSDDASYSAPIVIDQAGERVLGGRLSGDVDGGFLVGFRLFDLGLWAGQPGDAV